MEKSKEYYQFLEDLAKQIDKERKEEKEIYEGTIVDCNEFPCGSAINWKIKHIKFNDWEKIPLREIAIAIKENVNMPDFATDYGIELIKREKFKSLR